VIVMPFVTNALTPRTPIFVKVALTSSARFNIRRCQWCCGMTARFATVPLYNHDNQDDAMRTATKSLDVSIV
jgi:hypothetical protein